MALLEVLGQFQVSSKFSPSVGKICLGALTLSLGFLLNFNFFQSPNLPLFASLNS